MCPFAEPILTKMDSLISNDVYELADSCYSIGYFHLVNELSILSVPCLTNDKGTVRRYQHLASLCRVVAVREASDRLIEREQC